MLFLELDCDPWRDQSFVEHDAFLPVRLPIDDTDAFNLYPEHRWVYDKPRITEAQGIECGTCEIPPSRYPVFCKPAINLKGLDADCHLLWSDRDLHEHCGEGYFWMRVLTGEHVSTDLAVVEGGTEWCRHTRGMADGGGAFDCWVIEERSRPRLERFCREWIRANLPGYVGMVNIESIGGRIISVHLRSADQWPDLYGRKWLDAVAGLHRGGTWDLVDNDRAEGYSLVLSGSPCASYTQPEPQFMATLRAAVGISSIHLMSSDARSIAVRATPGAASDPGVAGAAVPAQSAGGRRLAVINSFNLETALRVRAVLAREFGVPDPGGSVRATG